jgi:ketosteroid isomerase-like protein
VTGDERAVVAANAAFYAAFQARDLAGMEALWARVQPVAVIHPGWPPVHGRVAVLETWRRILEGPAPPEIACSRAWPYVNGDSAFVICYEKLPGGDLVATNVFVREEGQWRIVHHQAGPTPPPADDAGSDLVH